MGSTPLVVLVCPRCGNDQVHEVEYAGPILLATYCVSCGLETRHARATLTHDYAHDFEQRILTKPRRVLRAAMADPRGFVRQLPGAVLTKPYRLGEEWAALHHALHPDCRDRATSGRPGPRAGD